MEELQLLKAEDVAKILKVSTSAVFKWAKKEIIPSYRLHEKCLRFKVSDVGAFVEKGKKAGSIHKNGERPVKRLLSNS